MSLDDMKLQHQEAYDFEVKDSSPESRLTMRIASVQEVKRFLEDRQNYWEITVRELRRELHEAEASSFRFREGRERLFPSE